MLDRNCLTHLETYILQKIARESIEKNMIFYIQTKIKKI